MRIQGYIGEVSTTQRSLRQIKLNSSRYFRHKNVAYIGGAYGIQGTAGRIDQHGFVVSKKKAASSQNNLR